MQNWKIKRMSYRRIHAWIVAINQLLSVYVTRKRLGNCPLCNVSKCRTCLWHIIEGMDCDDFVDKHKFRGQWGNIRNRLKWRTLRIPMLKNWKKILKLELARREE